MKVKWRGEKYIVQLTVYDFTDAPEQVLTNRRAEGKPDVTFVVESMLASKSKPGATFWKCGKQDYFGEDFFEALDVVSRYVIKPALPNKLKPYWYKPIKQAQ